MRCGAVAPYLTAYAAGDLAAHTTAWVSSHLAACPGCAALTEQSAQVTAALRSLEPDAIEPPEWLASAVMAKVAEREDLLAKRKLLPLPFVASEQLGQQLAQQIGRLPGEVARVVTENRDAIVGVASTAAVAAGAAWLAVRALRSLRAPRPESA